MQKCVKRCFKELDIECFIIFGKRMLKIIIILTWTKFQVDLKLCLKFLYQNYLLKFNIGTNYTNQEILMNAGNYLKRQRVGKLTDYELLLYHLLIINCLIIDLQYYVLYIINFLKQCCILGQKKQFFNECLANNKN